MLKHLFISIALLWSTATAAQTGFVDRYGASIPQPVLDFNFMLMAQKGALDSRITCTRSTVATDGLYTDAAGSSYNSYAINQARLVPGKGLLIEGQRTNRALNSTAPANHTTGTIPTGDNIFWVIGTGSATIAAGTAVGTGFGTATAGNPVRINITVAGTVTITVTGSLNRFQLEESSFASSFIVTAGAAVLRQLDRCNTTYATGKNFTFYARAMLPDTTASSAVVRHLVSLNSSDTSRIGIRVQTTTTYPQMQQLGGSGAAAGGDTGSMTSGVYFKQTIVSTGTSYLQTKNSGGTLFGGMVAPTGNTTISFGQTSSTSSTGWFGFIAEFAYWPYALSTSQAISSVR